MKDNITYDIGLACVINLNIGNNLTNYALYQYLSDLGYHILLIANSLNENLYFPNIEDTRIGLFINMPYKNEDIMFVHKEDKWELYHTAICRKFVLGSDQLWRNMFVEGTDFFTCLDWVNSSQYKMAYAASFGIDSLEGSKDIQEKMGYLLKRFQNISVREQDGVKILRDLFDIEAEWVLDPVFLCEKRNYERMADKGKIRLPKEKYVGAYLLDMTKQKQEAVLHLSEKFTDKVYTAMTQSESMLETDVKLQLLSEPAVEEWLAMIEESDFFITDSFHGVCFALIFQKQFCVIFDKENWRGFSRIRSLLELLNLSSRLILENEDRTSYGNYPVMEKILSVLKEKIDYDRINTILCKECERSKAWLNTSLKEAENYHGQYNTYDFSWRLSGDLNRKIQTLQREIENLNKKIYKTRNELFLLSHMGLKNSIKRDRWEVNTAKIVGWGAGDCLKRNIHKIRNFYDMKYVCDKNSGKWGKVIDEKLICISPEELSKMKYVMVIIMVDRGADALEIAEELLRMGITNFQHVESWLSFVEK